LSVTVQGNQLTVHASQPIAGTFTIQVTVSDGFLTATRSFTVTLTNTPPTLAAIAPPTMAKGQTSLTIALSASDADNDKLTFSAVALTPSAAAYQLEQKYGFQEFNGSYYTNIQGHNEKWLIDRTGTCYCILPTGQIYRWSLTMAQTLTAANYIGTLDPSFWTNPELLWDAAPPVTPALTFSFQNNQLTIHRPANLTGVFYVTVTVSDGLTTTQQTLQVTLN